MVSVKVLKLVHNMALGHDCSLFSFVSFLSLMSPTVFSVNNSTFLILKIPL